MTHPPFFLATSTLETGFFIGSAVFLLFQIWRGWRSGVVRAGMSLVALVGSGVIGWFGGKAVGNLAEAFLPSSLYLVWFLATAVLALVSYFAILLFSVLLFKKTADHSSFPVRVGFGIGGAFIGFLIGLVVLSAAVSLIRATGGMSFGKISSTRPSQLASLKQTLESGTLGDIVRLTDPIPQSFYDGFSDLSQLSTNPEAVSRFLQYPDVANLLQNPKFTALALDPSIQAAAQQKNSLALLSNPKLRELASDPEIIAAAQKINLTAALAYALQKNNPPARPQP